MKKILSLLFIMFLMTFVIAVAAENPRWVAQPIKVYLPEVQYFSNLMQRAFSEWEEKSDSLVRFKYTSRPSEADISVQFVDFVTNCSSNHAVGCTHMTARGRNYYKSLIIFNFKNIKKI